MSTNKVDVSTSPSGPASAPPAAPQGSLPRLLVLLGLLAVVVGAYAYDILVARPGCDAADKKIQDFVDARNKLGVNVKEGSQVTPADIQKELGMSPTRVEKHADEGYEVEYYCWWGHVPLMNMRRHFISVVYVGNEPRRFSSHHRETPPEEALPISQAPAKDAGQPLPEPESAGAKPGKATEPTEKAGDDAGAAPPAQAKEAASDPPAGNEKAAGDK